MIGQFFIGKDKAYLSKRGGGVIASVNELNDLDYGAIAIISSQKLITAVADLDDVQDVQIAVGTSLATQGAVLSKRIERGSQGFKDAYSFKTYSPAVSEVIFIGDNADNIADIVLPASLLKGDEISVTVMDTSNNFIPEKSIKRVSYSIKSGDTQTTALTGLIALLNATGMGTFTAIDLATANAGIKFVGATPGVRYKITIGGIAEGTPILTAFTEEPAGVTAPNAPVAPFIGSGTYNLVSEAGDYHTTIFGNTSRNMLSRDLFKSGANDGINDAVVGVNYDMFTFNYGLSGNYPVSNHSTVPQYLQLAVPTVATSAAAATLIGVLQGLFTGVVTDTNPAESGAAEELENVG